MRGADMEKEFKNAFDYKVIYVFEINDENIEVR